MTPYYRALMRQPTRPLRVEELRLIIKMLRGKPAENRLIDQLHGALVRDMLDGGMGSIWFQGAKYGGHSEELSEGAFRDTDGVPVSVVLLLDDSGNLLQLDFFKADGSPLVRYPESNEFEIIERHGQLGYPPPNAPQQG